MKTEDSRSIVMIPGRRSSSPAVLSHALLLAFARAPILLEMFALITVVIAIESWLFWQG